MKIVHSQPFKTQAELKKSEIIAKLDIEKKLDKLHGRKPLNWEQITQAAKTVPGQTEAGIPIFVFLIAGAGAGRFKDDPAELYNFYLLEIKPLLP